MELDEGRETAALTAAAMFMKQDYREMELRRGMMSYS